MKTTRTLITALALALVGAESTLAQAFSSGSDGSKGALDVTAGNLTIDLPPDGILNYTTINVASGRTLRFNRNALNTPVILLAQGDVTIAGLIDVSGSAGTASIPGLGGPGGFDGGAPGSTGLAGGDGQGPGGGKSGTLVVDDTAAGPGSYATTSTVGPVGKRGATYGSPLLFPIVGGSGGGGGAGNPGWGGGGGGGAIMIASSTRITVTGTIRSLGGTAYSAAIQNTGSGGAIRLVAPIVSGTGSFDVRGDGGRSGKGDGRIRVDALDRSALAFSFVPDNVASVGGLLAVFPSPLPRLDITEAAGKAVPDNTPTQVFLPAGSPAAQVVKVRARDFGQVVPIRVVLTPDSGPAQSYDAQIDNTTVNPAETTVNVTLQPNVLTHIHVWTR